MKRTRELVDRHRNVVDEKDTNRGYKYGGKFISLTGVFANMQRKNYLIIFRFLELRKTIVCINLISLFQTDNDRERAKLKGTVKSLTIRGFVKEGDVSLEHWFAKGVHIIVPDVVCSSINNILIIVNY